MKVCNTFVSNNNELKSLIEIERSIVKTYRKDLWKPFIKAVKEFNLIEENDKIAVAISGGKDSLLLAKLFMELNKYSEVPFSLEFIAMDPGFNHINREMLEKNCQILGIPIKIKNSDVFSVASKIASANPCYMCARMRRGFLYNFAKELGCNKLALGHHFDDVIETTLLNVFFGSQFKTMVPKIKSENFDDMELIRPLVFIREKDIIRFFNNAGINTMNCGCEVAAEKYSSKRAYIKELIRELKKDNPDVEISIFNSATNVNINQVYGYEHNQNKFDFNDIFKLSKKSGDKK